MMQQTMDGFNKQWIGCNKLWIGCLSDSLFSGRCAKAQGIPTAYWQSTEN